MLAVATELPPRICDSRKSPRERVFLSGRIIYNDSSFTIECRIKDISACGARIVLSAGLVIPTHNVLMEVRGRIIHDAVVARIASPEYGLKFTSTHRLDGAMPPHLQHLKRFR